MRTHIRTHHLLHTLRKQDEVRHLLIDVKAGAGAAKLSQLSAAIETPLATGSQFEMEKEARELAQDWAAEDGFKFMNEQERVFDSLKNTVALATCMGYRHVLDARYKNLTSLPLNIGICPLDQRPGMSPKNYIYAFTGTTIYAVPWSPPFAPQTQQETMDALRQAIAFQESVGPSAEFVLGGE
jgi:hypothetical protein